MQRKFKKCILKLDAVIEVCILICLPTFFDPLMAEVEVDVDEVEDLVFFLSDVFPYSLTTMSILIVSMDPTNDKFEPQVSNEDTLPLPCAKIRKQNYSFILFFSLFLKKIYLPPFVSLMFPNF